MADPHISGPQLRSSRKKSENTSSVSLASAQAGNADGSFQQGADAEISESTSVEYEHLSCYICGTSTHFEQIGITKSELSVIITKASIGVTWICENCNSKSDRATSLNMEVDNLKTSMDSRFENLEKSMQTQVQSLHQTLNETLKLEMENYRKVMTAKLDELQQIAVEVKQPETENNVKHTLLVQPKDTEGNFTKEGWSDIVKKCIAEKLNDVPVKKTVLTSKGMGYMLFPNKESRNLAAKTLEPDCKITIQDKNTKSVYPKLKVHGIPKEQFSKKNTAALRDELIRKNDFIRRSIDEMDKTFEVVFLTENKESKFSSAILRVDPTIKEAICGNGNRVFLGLSSCKVTNQYHIVQCYTCQEFGHKAGSDKCPLKGSTNCVCLYCAEKHVSRDCPVKKNSEKHRCANCLKSDKTSSSSNNNCSHPSNSAQCPLLQLELKALLNRTMGCKTNEIISKNEITT